MNRRHAIRTIGGLSITGLSGCTGAITSTPTPSPTPTPEPSKTEVLEVSLISDWKEYGDVVDNQIHEITPEEGALVGVRAIVTCSEDNEVRWRNRIEITRGVEVVASGSVENEDFSNNCNGWVHWEQARTLYYDNEFGSEWETGEYFIEVTIDDFYSGETATGKGRFQVVAG